MSLDTLVRDPKILRYTTWQREILLRGFLTGADPVAREGLLIQAREKLRAVERPEVPRLKLATGPARVTWTDGGKRQTAVFTALSQLSPLIARVRTGEVGIEQAEGPPRFIERLRGVIRS